ncbi:MAG: WYL domain-containing protein [Actinobacteria bacterium]|nr:WYL domain-containing protein [Actinomycetota bacterium]MBU1944599.1 WYL domain-containing protein [Actinomycetota bacterium]MBU2689152.1 WYL domain-containing protein [Actinomycetota bacterium]
MSEHMLLPEVDFCAFDLETTGLSNFSRIVEVGAVRFRLEAVHDRFSELVHPGRSIPEVVIGIHGITDTMVAGAAAAPEVIDRFFEFADGCVLVAHNAAFDSGIMATELHRAGLEPPEPLILDTIALARRFLPRLPSYGLGALSRDLGIGRPRKHRALEDAEACRRIFERTVLSVPEWQGRPLDLLADAAGGCTLRYRPQAPSDLPPGMEAILAALERRGDVVVVYRGGSKGTVPRRLSPVSVYSAGGHCYMEARCHVDNVTKSFRVDRIASVELWED